MIGVSNTAARLLAALDIDVHIPGPQSSLDPAGPQAEKLQGLWSEYFWASVAVYAIVIVLLFFAVICAGAG